MQILVALLTTVLQIALVVWVLRFFVRAHRTAGGDPLAEPGWERRPAFSASDAASQLLLAVGAMMAQSAALVANQHAGKPLDAYVIMLAFTAVLFFAAYRYRSPVVLAVACLNAVTVWFVALLAWCPETDYAVAAPAGLVLLGVTLWGAARISESFDRHERFANVYWLLGMLVITVSLFALSTRAGLDMLARLEVETLSDWRVASASALVTIAAVAALGFGARRRAAAVGETVWLAVLAVAMLASALFPLADTSVRSGNFESAPVLSAAATAWAIGFNLLLLSGLIGLAFLGYSRREDRLITLSAILLFIFVVVKYFDWLFALLDRSVAFIGAGIILLAAGLAMERGRRFALKAMEADVR